MNCGKYKDFLKFGIVLLSCLMLSMSLLGCVGPRKTNDEFFEDGYLSFVKANKDSNAISFLETKDFFDTDQAILLLDLTEDGKNQTAIDVPETVEGLPVICIAPMYKTKSGYLFDPYGYLANYGSFSSETLERLYLNSSIKSIGSVDDRSLDCFRLKRIIINNQVNPIVYHDLDGWLLYGGAAKLPREIVIAQNTPDNFFQEATELSDSLLKTMYIANIEYKYNYDAGTGQDNYRIDLIKDNTETPFEFANPYRAGYTFGGWYLEPECINEWDRSIDCLLDEETGDILFWSERNFEEDKPSREERIKDIFKEYINQPNKILRLYAKWTVK